jgi:hypothetical protein
MITHVAGPTERLVRRLQGRWAHWIDSMCSDDPPEPPVSRRSRPEPPRATPEPELRGLPAVLRRLEQGDLTGSQRDLAQRLGTSRATVQRARKILNLANIP